MPRRVKALELKSIIEKVKSRLAVELKASRNNMRLIQNKTSEIIGIDLSHYQNIEHGKALPSVEVLFRMSEVLRFSVDNLLIDNKETEKIKKTENILKHCTDEQLDIIEAVANTLIARNSKNN